MVCSVLPSLAWCWNKNSSHSSGWFPLSWIFWIAVTSGSMSESLHQEMLAAKRLLIYFQLYAVMRSSTLSLASVQKKKNNCKVYVQVLTSINIIRNHSSHKRSHLEALYPCFLWKDKEQHTVTLQVWERPVLDIINFCRNKCNWWRIVPMTSPNYLTISNIGACVAKWPDLGFEIWSSRVQVPLWLLAGFVRGSP